MLVVQIVTLAEKMGVHRNTIRNWVKRGRIKARPAPGKGLMFTREDFRQLCLEFHLDPESFELRELGVQVLSPEAALAAPGGEDSREIFAREESMSDKVVGSVLVVGGGIAGIQAALDLADSGYYVHLVEKSSGIGGKMSQLDKTYPTNDCAM